MYYFSGLNMSQVIKVLPNLTSPHFTKYGIIRHLCFGKGELYYNNLNCIIEIYFHIIKVIKMMKLKFFLTR